MNFKLKTSELLLYHGNSHNLVIGGAGNTVVKGWAVRWPYSVACNPLLVKFCG